MWDHFVLHQYLCGTTLHCTVYLISTYVRPLCIAKVGIYLISRPTYMCVHFVLHCDCLPHQYLCGTTLYCISTYVGPLCIALFTSSVPMWDHFALHQYIYGTTLYFTVYLISTYVGPYCIVSVHMWDHFVLHCLLHQYLFGPQYVYTSSVGLSACVTTLYCTVTVYLINTYVGPLCIASVPMWDHFVLHRLPHQYLCGTILYCISTYVGPLCIALFTSPVPIWTTLYCNSRYMPHQ